MSKIFLIGDVHIALGYPNNTDKWLNVHKEYFSKFLIPLLKREVKQGDIIIQLGDLFDNRNIIPIDLLNYGMDVIEEISNIAPIHIIVGNHDLWSKSASEINSVRPLRYMPNVFVYDKATKIKFNDLDLLMLPFIEKKNEFIRSINEHGNCDYLFCHSDLNGCKMHLTSVANKNTDKVDIDEFSKFGNVWSGHIHLVQSNKNFTFAGSIFQMDRNDRGDKKGIFVLNTDDNTHKFIENNVSPIFKNFSVFDENDIDNLDELKGTKDYIDLSISNKLLISNRKLRRKLEVMLEKGNFSSIDYIDDITESLIDDKVEDVVILDDNNIEISSTLEYDEYIKEYILKQEYNSDKFRSGVISEFITILDIYNENFKNKKSD